MTRYHSSNDEDLIQKVFQLESIMSEIPLGRLSGEEKTLLLRACATLVGVTHARATHHTMLAAARFPRWFWWRYVPWWRRNKRARRMYVTVVSLFVSSNMVATAVHAVLNCSHERRAAAARDVSLYLLRSFVGLGVQLNELVCLLSGHAEMLLAAGRRDDAKQTAAVLLGLLRAARGDNLSQELQCVLQSTCLLRVLSLLHEAVGRGPARIRLLASFCARALLVLGDGPSVTALEALAKRASDTQLWEGERHELAELLVHAAAHRNNAGPYKETLTQELVPPLLKVVGSGDRVLSLLGCKALILLFDRLHNVRHLMRPQLYSCAGVVRNYSFSVRPRRKQLEGDADLLLSWYGELHSSLLGAMALHADADDNLSHAYAAACLVVVEVPSPAVAVNVAHLAFSLQERTMALSEELSFESWSHVHAVCAALLSLLCYTHEEDAPPLCELVARVCEQRRINAPHLLPPLRRRYSPQAHHVTGFDKELFFDENELQFALQRSWLTMRGIRRGALVLLS